MISYIKGIYSDMDEEGVVVEANGVGYYIYTPQSVMASMPHKGMEVKIYTYMRCGEDGVFLYGFLTREELSMFKKLITVNGVGPKAGISVLSTLSVRELTLAIIGDDEKSISRAQGIGPKTAKRIIMELKDRIDTSDIIGGGELSKINETAAKLFDNDALSEAELALMALGYTKGEALKALSKIEEPEGLTVNDIITFALKNI